MLFYIKLGIKIPSNEPIICVKIFPVQSEVTKLNELLWPLFS